MALTRRSYAREHQLKALAIIKGIATAGPQQLDEAIRRCLADAKQPIDAIYSGGPLDAEATERAALAAVFGNEARQLPRVSLAPLLGMGIAATAAFAFSAAVEALQRQTLHGLAPHDPTAAPLRRILVLAEDGRTGSCAILLACSGRT